MLFFMWVLLVIKDMHVRSLILSAFHLPRVSKVETERTGQEAKTERQTPLCCSAVSYLLISCYTYARHVIWTNMMASSRKPCYFSQYAIIGMHYQERKMRGILNVLSVKSPETVNLQQWCLVVTAPIKLYS